MCDRPELFDASRDYRRSSFDRLELSRAVVPFALSLVSLALSAINCLLAIRAFLPRSIASLAVRNSLCADVVR
jgi:hypothetical protein